MMNIGHSDPFPRHARSLRSLLGILGRQARWALPAGVFAGIVLPDLATLLRPLLTAAVIGTLTTALLRMDWNQLAQIAVRPALPAVMALWLLVLSPLVVWLVCVLLGVPPDLRLLLVLQAAAPPIGSAAVFAMILGLDGAVAVIGTVVSTLLLPLTLTPLAGWLLPGAGLEVDLGAFFARVTLLVVAPFLFAWLLRRALGTGLLNRNADSLGGLNVVLLVIFAVAVMDGVTGRLLADPGYIGTLLGLACVAAVVLHLAGFVLFRRAGLSGSYGAAILSGNRNMGLMLVVTAGTAGEAFSLYVGIAQIPMYFAPLVLTPFLKRSQQREAAARRG
jgi:bile acid:Na+ symporter, BASS family